MTGLLDVATIAGRQRLLAQREVMERLHGLTPATADLMAFIEEAHHGN